MISPTHLNFVEDTSGGKRIPVRTTIPADLETPVSVFLKLKKFMDSQAGGSAFLFESVERGVQMGRHSFIGLSAETDIQLINGVVRTRRGDSSPTECPLDPADPMEAIRTELGNSALKTDSETPLPPPFGGAVGYLGFDMVKYFENISLPESALGDLPDYRFMFPRTLIVFDHVKSEMEIITLPLSDDPNAAYKQACGEIEAILQAIDQPLPSSTRQERKKPGTQTKIPDSNEGLAPNLDRETFMNLVEQAQEHILAGDAFQIVLSQRLSGETNVSPFQIYRALRILNPSPYLFFLDFADFQLIGSSPEMMVQLTDGRLHVNPIAGTRPRGKTIGQDNELAAELLADEKEQAEHVMLVDLGRNDLGRVCTTGSIEVEEFMAVEKYSHVMHLVSRVSGQLNADLDMFDALQATFPAGTVSGAPKIRAMEILSELEGNRRGHYAGAVGYFGQDGNMDMCITIRTLLMQGNKFSVQAGAGIVADSDPAREHQESLDKIRALTRAVRNAEEGL